MNNIYNYLVMLYGNSYKKKLKINNNFRKQKLKYITTASKAMTAALQRITANEIKKPTYYKVEGSSGSYTYKHLF